VGARYLYISTDYVFDGAREPGTAYVEEDRVGPLNVYGASKAAGEQLVAQTTEDYVIVRVSSLFGVAGARGKGGNFIETILKKAREGGPLKVVNDQWMTPTYTADAAEAILRVALSDVRGVVHVTNPEHCTWHTLATEAVSLSRLGVPVEAVPASAFSTKVRRPRNSALETGRLASLLGTPLRPWSEALRAYLVTKGHVIE
jgi:dTDP-4-dehydrorhamnose reductase